MINRNRRRSSLALTAALVAGNILALNILVSGWSTARLDLTEEGLFSISPATKNILTGLEEELTIYGYFSKRTHPKLAPLIPELIDLLEEYRAVSGGRVNVQIVDPGEDEAAEEEAADRFGVRSTPFSLKSKYEDAIVNAYFALVVKYGDQYKRYGFEDLISIEPDGVGDIEVRLRNPEYDLTRAIKKVVFGFRSTNELFERVEGTVRLTAIWTPDALPEMLAETPQAVRSAAAELSEASGGKFSFEELDPSGNEQLQQQLYDQFGARPMSLGLFSDSEFYLYALLDVGGNLEQIPITGSVTGADVREAVENALRRRTPGFLKTIGIATSDEPQIPPQLRMQMQMPPQPPPEFQELKAMLGQDYQVREVDLNAADALSSDIDVLLVLKPRRLEPEAVFNLDQYLMRGGRVVICTGNFSPDLQSGLSVAPIESGLDEWLAHHGVTIEQTLVLDDRNQPLPIPEIRQTPFGPMRSWVMAPYPYLVQVRADGFLNREITASLDSVGIYWGSPLLIDEAASGELEVLPILRSSERSWTDDDLYKVGFVDYQVPEGATESYLLAAALNGRFRSYYAEHDPPPLDPISAEETGEDGADTGRVVIEQSPETRLVIVGNSEFLSDFVARALATTEGGFFFENLRFAQNLIDWSGSDNEMLQIRSRGMISRRLERTEKSRQLLIEGVNYTLPALLLGALGGYLHWRRRSNVIGSSADRGQAGIASATGTGVQP